jgi:hypothetical protein
MATHGPPAVFAAHHDAKTGRSLGYGCPFGLSPARGRDAVRFKKVAGLRCGLRNAFVRRADKTYSHESPPITARAKSPENFLLARLPPHADKVLTDQRKPYSESPCSDLTGVHGVSTALRASTWYLSPHSSRVFFSEPPLLRRERIQASILGNCHCQSAGNWPQVQGKVDVA